MKTIIAGFGTLILALMFMFVVGCTAGSEPVPTQVKLARMIVNQPGVDNWVVYGSGQGHRYLTDTAVPGRSSVRIEVSGPQAHSWDTGASALIPVAIHRGTTVGAAFWARAPEGAQPMPIRATFQGPGPAYPVFGSADLAFGPQWKLYLVQGESSVDLAAYSSTVVLQLGAGKQTIELGPLFLLAGPALPSQGALDEALRHTPVGTIENVVIDTSQVKIAATFRTPVGKGPFPAMALFPGSPAYARSGFHPISDVLIARGVAILDFDKRGCGESTGTFSTATIVDLINDAAAVTAYLKTRSDVDHRRIGVLGYSQGAVIAPAVAVKAPFVAYVVVLGVGATRFDVLELRQWEAANLAAGVSEAKIAKGREALPKLFAAVETAGSDEEAMRRAKDFFAPYVADKTMTQEQADAAVASVASRATRESLAYDPTAVLRQVKVPVLAISGSLDTAVPPGENFPLLRQALADNPDVTVVELPGLNHLFQNAKTGTNEESKKLSEPALANAEMLKIIADWIGKRVH